MVKDMPAMWETSVQSLGRDDLLEKGIATHSTILSHYSFPENSMDRGACQATFYGVTKSQTRLNS